MDSRAYPGGYLAPEHAGDQAGDYFGYGPGTVVLAAAANLGPPVVPGALQTIQFAITDDAHSAHFMKCRSTGPFLVQIRIGQRYLFNLPMPSDLVFGNTAGNPAPLPRPLRTVTNDVIYFDLQDISGAANQVWILLDGENR